MLNRPAKPKPRTSRWYRPLHRADRSKMCPDGTDGRPWLFKAPNAGISLSGAVDFPLATVCHLLFMGLPLFVFEKVQGRLREHQTRRQGEEYASGGRKGVTIVCRMQNIGFTIADDILQAVRCQSPEGVSFHHSRCIPDPTAIVLHRWPITSPCLRPFDDPARCSRSARRIASSTVVSRGCEHWLWSTM